MNTLATLLALAPLINIGGSVLLSWFVSLVVIAAVVWFVIWLVTMVAGPKPPIPEGARWVVWAVVIALLLVFIFAAFGLRIP